jgi:hypothetical protein
MHYLVLLYGDESAATEPGTPEFDAEMAGYVAFGELAAAAIRGGAALELSKTTRTIRHEGGAVTVTDGPFAETAEALGGYYVLEADDLDQVIDLVRHIPATTAPGGGSEIRPMVVDQLLREEGEALPDLWLATLHRVEDAAEQPGSPEWDDGAAEHGRFTEAHRDRLVRAAALHPTTSATTVRVRDGEVLLSDGPYPEVTEVVGGLYVIQGTAEEAEAVAREIPVGDDGAVELRPVMDLGDLA